jgi:hypothetical protein
MRKVAILVVTSFGLAACVDPDVEQERHNAMANAHDATIMTNFDKLTPENQCNFLRQRLAFILTKPWNADNPQLKEFERRSVRSPP